MKALPNSERVAPKIQHLYHQVLSLLVYRDILEHEAGRVCVTLLCGLVQSAPQKGEILESYGQWFYAIAHTAPSWQAWVEQQILAADNPFTRQAQHQAFAALPPALVTAARHDLRVLEHWATAGPALMQSALAAQSTFELPCPDAVQGERTSVFEFSQPWVDALPALSTHYRQKGIGRLAQYQALRWQNQTLEGIEHPDGIQLSDLVGYEGQKMALQHNTEALLSGYRALNVLLYGSRGSGKSALVKALMTEYGDRGLRLIELSQAEMIHLPQVVEQLRTSPLKFVIFIDDLSFEEDEESYKALKVVLEGTLTARPQNVAVYATSNRRHLIREFFGDRPRPSNADEIHAWDTVQEKLSLGDRFGLTLTFEPANQETYLQIVHHLAQQLAVKLPEAELTHQALQWAVRQNTRSGRTARQFIDQLRAQLALQSS